MMDTDNFVIDNEGGGAVPSSRTFDDLEEAFLNFRQEIDADQVLRDEIREIIRELEQKARDLLTTLQKAHHHCANEDHLASKQVDGFHLDLEDYLSGLLLLASELKLPKSPLAPKVPIFRSLTVGPRLSNGPSVLSPDVSKRTCIQNRKDVGSFCSSPPPFTGVSAALSPSRLFGSSAKLSSSITIHRRQLQRPSLSFTPSFADNKEFPKFNTNEEDASNSPSVSLQFSATQSSKYANERRKLYHQASPQRTQWSKPSSSSEFHQTSSEFAGRRDSDNWYAFRKDSVGSAPSSGTPKSTPKLGKGGFGTVFIGKYDGKLVAIKQLYSRKKKQRLREESLCAELNAFRLNHPNIVRILAFTPSGLSSAQVVFEYVGPKNLQQVLDDVTGEKMDGGRRFRYSCEVAEALKYCHSQRVLHLDLKAPNVLLTEEGDHCKLADFGCSRVLQNGCDHLSPSPTLSSNAGDPKGLPATGKADVYSYGYLVWQCFSRKLPFEGLHPHTVVFCVVSNGLRPDCSSLNLEGSRDGTLLELMKNCWSQGIIRKLRDTS